jgi:hypothetical protein
MSVELLTLEMFSDKIDQPFLLDEPGAPPVEFKLIEATALPNFAKAARAPFSLFFTTRGDVIWPQRLYQLRNDALGSLTIFVVPIAKAGDVVTYQAVFN